MDDRTIIDQIYEAGLVPEVWKNVLDAIGRNTQSEGGVVFVTDRSGHPRFIASDAIMPAISAYAASGSDPNNSRPTRALAENHYGFLRDIDFLPVEHFEQDTQHQELRRYGLGWQVGTVVPMPSGELAVLTIDRGYEKGPHTSPHVSYLDILRPHLCRSMLMSARLGMKVAESTLTTLETIGLQALVINNARKVIATNALADAGTLLIPLAHGGLKLDNRIADQLFQNVVDAGFARTFEKIRSVPVPATRDRPAMVVHALPLRGQAHDLFSGAEILVIVNTIKEGQTVTGELLKGLFDLTAAEARLAQKLLTGLTLKEIATEGGIAVTTLRSHLRSILAKTGTRRQAELVTLLGQAGTIQG